MSTENEDAYILPASFEALREEIQALQIELDRVNILIKLNVDPRPVLVSRRNEKVDIEERLRVLREAKKMLTSRRHDTYMDAFYNSAHQVLSTDQLDLVFNRLLQDYPNYKKGPQ